MKMSDGTEYYKKPPSGGVAVAEKGKTQHWVDDDGNVWVPVRIEAVGKTGMWWRMKTGK